MLHMIGHAIFGLIVGLVARFLLPGKDPAGLIVTAILGMIGGWLGGQIGRWLGWYDEGHPAGFFMSVAGAMILFFAYRMIH
jgi:Predicted membrane protein